MDDRTLYRLRDIVDAVDQIDRLLDRKTFDNLQTDRFLRASFERFVEILSEASRHIPQSLKDEAPQLPWPRIGAIGNHLRHAYHRVDAEILWRIHADGELAALRDVVSAFVARLEP